MQLEHALVGATIYFVVAICATLFLLWKLHLDLLLATTVLHHHHAPFALWLLLIHHLFFRVVGDRFLLLLDLCGSVFLGSEAFRMLSLNALFECSSTVAAAHGLSWS